MLAATFATVAAAGATSAEAATAKIDYASSFTTRAPGTSSGLVYRVRFSDPHDANAKPPAVAHVHEVFPPGSRLDTAAVPRCTASDAELMLEGPSACPANTKVGHDALVFDYGAPPQDRSVPEDVTLLNGDHEIILVSHDPSGAYVVVRGKVTTDTLDIDVPPVPGTPPDGGAIKSEDVLIYEAHGFLTTPPTCPASGHWGIHIDYTYRDGTKQTASTATDCLRPQPGTTTGRGGLSLTFPARRTAHAHRRSSLLLSVSRAATGRLTIARGHRTVRARSLSLRAGANRLILPALARGKYRLTVTLHTADGARVTRTAKLRVSRR